MTRKQFAALMRSLFSLRNANGWSMGLAQYVAVLMHLLERDAPRVLVIGCGVDSPLYLEGNPHGQTLFLEHDEEWIRNYSGLPCLRVSYQSRLHTPLEPCTVPQGSETVAESLWDCVLVDGPQGWLPQHPGRQQSIYLASRVMAEGGVVFVHDHNREGERHWASLYLGSPVEVVRERGRGDLAIFRPGDRSGVS
jgi:glucuronoxylan 4-O-methyltransferase